MCLQVAEKNSLFNIPAFSGWGKTYVLPSVVLLIAMVSLAGIPPTAGFTSKLFIFTALWDAYEQTDKNLLLWLLVFGLLNTVVSLFYYLKIPYYSFLKNNDLILPAQKTKGENLLALILVLMVLFLFIQPGLLMGWLNRINFVL
jgi:NADH-quinone oxidoreductase subunit N